MDAMAREINQTELDRQIDHDLERVDWWVDTVKTLAEPIPGYDGRQNPFAPQDEAAVAIKPASA